MASSSSTINHSHEDEAEDNTTSSSDSMYDNEEPITEWLNEHPITTNAVNVGTHNSNNNNNQNSTGNGTTANLTAGNLADLAMGSAESISNNEDVTLMLNVEKINNNGIVGLSAGTVSSSSAIDISPTSSSSNPASPRHIRKNGGVSSSNSNSNINTTVRKRATIV